MEVNACTYHELLTPKLRTTNNADTPLKGKQLLRLATTQLWMLSPCHLVELCRREVTWDVRPGDAGGLDAGHETQFHLRVRLDMSNHDLRTRSSGQRCHSQEVCCRP